MPFKLSKSAKAMITKWKLWNSAIEDELTQLLASQQIFRYYKVFVQANPKIDRSGMIFHHWVRDNYYTYVAMAIRRQVDLKKDVISLMRLIDGIKKNPQYLTRAWHMSLYSPAMQAAANDFFTKMAGTGSYFDPKIAERDLKKLEEISSKVTQIADRAIAHNSNRPSGNVTFNEIDECIRGFQEMAQKYYLLLTASSINLDPSMDHSWLAIFADWQSQDAGDS